MKRRLVTIHKAVKAAQAAEILELLAVQFGEDAVEINPTRDNGIVVQVDDWKATRGRVAHA